MGLYCFHPLCVKNIRKWDLFLYINPVLVQQLRGLDSILDCLASAPLWRVEVLPILEMP